MKKAVHFPSLAVLAFAPAAWADTPMSYLHTFGPAGDPVTRLNWGLTAISVLVCVIVGVLLLAGIFRKRPPLQPDDAGRLPLGRNIGGLRWIYIGTALTVLVLLGSTVWNTLTLAAVSAPQEKPGLTVKVTAHQWWWEVEYQDNAPSRIVVTANEIHIPVGKPVFFQLHSADVIHSFWVPRLGGKTDLIPGQVNKTWLQADHPGVYRGQCTEYCGAQHAHMALYVVAQEPAAFDAWREAQLQPAAGVPEDNDQAARGSREFANHCGVCHAVHGTDAFGNLGPDLTHLMSRKTIAAGLLDNTMSNLQAWVADPQALKPGTLMPRVELSGTELQDVVAYLETLK